MDQRHSSCFQQLEEGELLRAAADARDMEQLVAQGASGSARAGIALTLTPPLLTTCDTFATWVFFPERDQLDVCICHSRKRESARALEPM